MALHLPLAVNVVGKDLAVGLQANGGRKIIKRRFYFNDFNTAATTANNDTLVLPGGVVINRVVMSLIKVFSGGSVSAATISVGTTSSATAYMAATNVFTGASASGAVTNGGGGSLNNFAGGNATPNALGTVRVQCVTTSDNASNLTAGSFDLFLELSAFDTRTT
jgi:hypothetical protein